MPIPPSHTEHGETRPDEHQDIPLIIFPSSYSPEERNTLHLEEVTELERRLRSGQLIDIISDLRLMIRRKALLLHVRKTKRVNSGKSVWTRSQARLGTIHLEVDRLHEAYNCGRRALERLGDKATLALYPVMKREDLEAKGVVNYLRVGRGYDKLTWIWRTHKTSLPDDQTSTDWRNWNMEGMS